MLQGSSPTVDNGGCNLELMRKISSHSFLKKAALTLAVLLVLISVIGFFIAPPLVKSFLVKKLAQELHRDVAINKITVNPFMLSLNIKGLSIKEPKGQKTFIAFDDLYLNLQLVSVYRRGIVLSEIRLENPYVNIVRNENLSYNFSDLMERKQPEPAAKSAPPGFSLNNIQIKRGAIDFWDSPKQTRHTIKGLNVTVPFVSNLPYLADAFVQPFLEAQVNGDYISFKGRSKPFAESHETLLDVNIKDFDIPYYLAYVPVKMDFILKSAALDIATKISYVQYKDKKPSLSITGDVGLKRLDIRDKKGGPMVEVPLLGISIASSDIMSGHVHFGNVLCDSPVLNVVRNRSGKMNVEAFTDLNREKKKEEDKQKFLFEADAIELKDGKISFSDHMKEKPFRTSLENIGFRVDHLSTARDAMAVVALAMKTESNETIEAQGEFSIDPVLSNGSFKVGHVPIKKYSPYYNERILFSVENGMIDLQSQYRVAKADSGFDISISDMEIALQALRLKRAGETEDFLKIPSFVVKGIAADTRKKEVSVGQVATNKGVLNVRRSREGKLDILDLMRKQEGRAQTGKSVAAKTGTERPWKFLLKKVSVGDYSFRFEDLVPPDPVDLTVEKFSFRGGNFSTAKNVKGKASLSCSLAQGGEFSSEGTVRLNPMLLDARVSAKDIDITSLQPYFTDKVKIIITGGAVSANGSISAAYNETEGPKASYKGSAHLSGFASVDKVNYEDFLKWDSLFLNGMDVSYDPMSVKIDEIALADFYSRFIINPDGTLNVQGIVAEQEKTKGDAPPSKPAADLASAKTPVPGEINQQKQQKIVKIEKVTLQGGTVSFSDRHITPEYSANLMEIGGRISGLSSEENILADVDLKGKLDKYAPLEITGKINPLREDLFVDLKIDYKDMELSPLTPYSGKYAGYTIQKGKLSFNMKYLIEKKKLDAQNSIFLDQFAFGERVESPDATKLPVRLAIALLKNRKGEINLDLPVSGYIDDPKFSIGSIVIKIIVNILVKVATSPFALLGALFGGGEELSAIDFEYGDHHLPESQVKKLETLVKALYDRPGLKLEIEGHADTEKDKEGLRQYLYKRKVKAQKLKDMLKKGQKAIQVDDVNVMPEEYPGYLKAAYKEEKFPKPRNIIGMAKSLPAPEMEKLMLTHIEVKDDELRNLASQRAQQVKEHILKSGKVEQERVFLIEPKSLQPEKKEKLKDSRVDLRLK